MSNQMVRFTGNRTGRTSYVIPRVGLVEQGDEFEVDEATAERYTTLHATFDGEMLSDFEVVDGADGTPETEEEADTSDSDKPKAKGSRKRTKPEVTTATSDENSAASAEGGQ